MVGTNNALNISSQGTVYFDGNGTFSEIDGSTAGFLLTSNGTGTAPSFQTISGSGILTLNGDSGSVSASSIYVAAGQATAFCGSSVEFVNSGTTSTLNVTDSHNSTILGYLAGEFIPSGSSNVGLGYFSYQNLSTGNFNTGIGYSSLRAISTLSNNVGIGSNTNLQTDHSNNAAIGYFANSTLSGNSSISLNQRSGVANSLIIGSATGSSTQQLNKTYIYGVNGNTISNPVLITINSTTSQLGVQALTQYNVLTGGATNAVNFQAPSTAGFVLTSNGAAAQPTFKLGAYGTRVATVFGKSASPAGTTSTAAFVMMGLGSTWAITPKNYTKVKAVITGQMTNGTTGDGVALKISFGTGAAPANAAAATGTVVGNALQKWTALTGLLTNGVPFKKTVIITGLTAGTAYWIDLQLEAITGGTASVKNLDFSAQELQY